MSSTASPRPRVDAGRTRLRLRALHVMGHGSARIARALGAREMTIRALVRGDIPTISPHLRDVIAARRRARTGNWCAPTALDDDQLDIPGYRPRSRWRPAKGTGVAADIHPPTRLSRKRNV